jgi:hypothetical protein
MLASAASLACMLLAAATPAAFAEDSAPTPIPTF